MSATFDTEKFSYYFRNYSKNGIVRPPTIFIDEESRFRTQVFYADQLESIGPVVFLHSYK